MKKIICSTLALLMAISPLSALALATDAAPLGTTPVKLTITPLTFKATVPTVLPFKLDAAGVTLPATEVSIVNGTMGPIKVVGVTTEATTNWKLTNYTDDFTSKKVNSKDLALQLNTDNVQTDGSITLTPQNWPTIEGNGNLRLDYQGKFAPQEKAITATVAHVSFVLDWDDATTTPEKPTIQYVLATDEDFSGEADGEFKYTGTDKYVGVPHVIKGIQVTSYNSMFADTSVEGVKSTNNNVTDMERMFADSQATSLDLSSFDTSNVTNMSQMFQNSKATTLDLSNFDTSNVTDMSWMFDRSQATTIDLSSFDTSNVIDMRWMFERSTAKLLDLSSFDASNVTDMSWMFNSSQATTGYAKTEADASRFNTSSDKPAGLTFTVKSSV